MSNGKTSEKKPVQGEERGADEGSKFLKHIGGEEKYAPKHTQEKKKQPLDQPPLLFKTGGDRCSLK